jgi:hypothetical protein
VAEPHPAPPGGVEEGGVEVGGTEVGGAEVGGVDGGSVGAVGERVGEGEVDGPVHTTPPSAKSVGAGLPPVYVPCRPNWTDPPAGTSPLYDSLRAVTAVPAWLTCACQAEDTRWPAG